MKRVILALLVILSSACPLFAAEKPVEALLPQSCAPGWAVDGKPAAYSPENLYKYIDGEAELYLPYGFERAATVMYAQPGAKGAAPAIAVELFKMGSLLDAFGIFSSYRDPTSEQLRLGAEGFVDESQLMFYQDRYFVRIEVSGAAQGGDVPLRPCGEAISRGLPAGAGKPPQLNYLNVQGAVPLTTRYYASGLLGHDFFGRGMTAEVRLGGEQVKSMVSFAASDGGAGNILDEYVKYLTGARAAVDYDKKDAFLHAVDPLYKGVAMRRSGRFVVGVTGLKEPHGGDVLVDSIIRHLPKE